MGHPAFVPYLGRETTTKALGYEWRFSRFNIEIADQYAEWAAKKLPDPIQLGLAAMRHLASREYELRQAEGIPDAVRQQEMYVLHKQQEQVGSEAMSAARSYLSFNDPAFQSLANSPVGSAKLIHLLLHKHHPEVSEEEAFILAQAIDRDEYQRILETVRGTSPPASGNAPAPAAAAASRGE